MPTKKPISSTKKTKGKSTTSEPKRIYRVQQNKVIAGIATGIGDYFSLDPTIIRLLFVFMAFFGGTGIIIYIILWIIMPNESELKDSGKAAIYSNVQEMKQVAIQTADSFTRNTKRDSKSMWAIILVVVGFLVLVDNFGFFSIDIEKLWPIVFIILGIFILKKR